LQIPGARSIFDLDPPLSVELVFLSLSISRSSCTGGEVVYAYEYAWNNSLGGLTSLNDYPFTDSDGTTSSDCQVRNKPLTVTMEDPRSVVGFSDSYSGEERIQRMKTAVAQQPISASMNSNCTLITSYASGVLTDDGNCSCANIDCINHAILIVGYNDTVNIPYWLIK